MFLLSQSSWRTCLMLLAAVYFATAFWVLLSVDTLTPHEETGLLDNNCSHIKKCNGEDNCNCVSDRNELLKKESPASRKASEHQMIFNDVAEETGSTTFLKRKSGRSDSPSPDADECKGGRHNTFSSILRDVFHSEGSCWLVLYVSIYKMAERGAFNNFPLFLLDKGVNMTELSFWNGAVSQTLSILGSMYGGIKLSRPSANCSRLILSQSIQRCILTILQTFCICRLSSVSHLYSDSFDFYLCMFSLSYLSFNTGVISTLTFTLMMQYSLRLPLDLQSSHYSVFASIEVAGKLAFATIAGTLVDYMGIFNAFMLFSLLSILPVILLFFEPKIKVHSE